MTGADRAERYWGEGGQTPGPQTTWKRELATHLCSGRVLDVACGDGASTPPGAFAVDAAISPLRKARADGHVVFRADLEAPWPVADDSVDAVLLFDVLEHVPDPAWLLREAVRVVRDDGLVLVAVPNAAHLANRIAAARGRTTDFTDAAHRRGGPVSDHLHRFTASSAADLVQTAGLEITERHVYVPPAFSEGPWRRLSFLARAIARLRLANLAPGALAYEFLFVARRGMRAELPPWRAGVAAWSDDDHRYRGYRASGRTTTFDHRVRTAIDLVPPARRVIDLGAGDGVITAAVADASGAELAVAVDAGAPEPMISPSRTIRRIEADVGAPLPFADGSADLVVSLEAIEHLLDPDLFLEEVARVLAPGGSVVLSTPRLDSGLVITSLVLGLQPPGVDASPRRRYGNPLGEQRPSGHVHLFTRRAMLEALDAHGFVVERYVEGRFSSSWRQARSGRRRRARDVVLDLAFVLYDLIPLRKDVIVVRARR